jgi:N-acetylglucosamine-6-phosphate deacetylase
LQSLTLFLSSITLIECVNNFLSWSGASIPQALKAVTSTPAAVLGLQGVKGTLEPGADADLVIFGTDSHTSLVVDEVWKFGRRVYGRTVA